MDVEYKEKLGTRIIDFFMRHKLLTLVIFLLIASSIIMLIWLAIQSDNPYNSPGGAREYTDPISGETLMDVNEEPEGGERKVAVVGFNSLINTGLTYAQIDIITTQVRIYFEENHPDVTTVNYKKDSFIQTLEGDAVFRDYITIVANDISYNVEITIIGTEGMQVNIAPMD